MISGKAEVNRRCFCVFIGNFENVLILFLLFLLMILNRQMFALDIALIQFIFSKFVNRARKQNKINKRTKKLWPNLLHAKIYYPFHADVPLGLKNRKHLKHFVLLDFHENS